MTHHPTDPGKIAPGGGETAETDILDEAVDAPRADRIALSAAMLISAVRYALGRKTYIVSETVRLRGALNGLIPEWRDAVEADGGRFCGPEGKAFAYCADQVEAVLRGGQ